MTEPVPEVEDLRRRVEVLEQLVGAPVEGRPDVVEPVVGQAERNALGEVIRRTTLPGLETPSATTLL